MAPIHNAARNGNVTDVRALLNSGANINARDNDGSTALIWAARFGHLATVRELLDRGANINARSNSGWTALICAIYYGHLAVVRLLLDRGANINARDHVGQTALSLAAFSEQLPVVRELLKRGANTNGILNRRSINENMKNVIRKHNAGLTIAKHYKAATLRRRATAISSLRKHLPNNMTRKILTARK